MCIILCWSNPFSHIDVLCLLELFLDDIQLDSFLSTQWTWFCLSVTWNCRHCKLNLVEKLWDILLMEQSPFFSRKWWGWSSCFWMVSIPHLMFVQSKFKVSVYALCDWCMFCYDHLRGYLCHDCQIGCESVMFFTQSLWDLLSVDLCTDVINACFYLFAEEFNYKHFEQLKYLQMYFNN